MEGFYLNLVNSAIDDTELKKLGQALSDSDIKTAFEVSHSLKGVYGNLGLTPLYKPISEMTELLRSGTQADCDRLYSILMQSFSELKKAAE